jgi:hypothetical protein
VERAVKTPGHRESKVSMKGGKRMADDKIQDLAASARSMLEASPQKFAHIDTTSGLIGILAEAITIMRKTGADSKTIARVLSHAAGELNSRPDP